MDFPIKTQSVRVLVLTIMMACLAVTSTSPVLANSLFRYQHHKMSARNEDNSLNPTPTMRFSQEPVVDAQHATEEVGVTETVPTAHAQTSEEQYGAHLINRQALFPHDTTWCLARQIKQVIDSPGCTARTIDNKMCAGQCFSYSVPKVLPHANHNDFQACDCCQPSGLSWLRLPLTCDGADGPFEVIKLIEIVDDCRCNPCVLRDTSISENQSFPTNSTQTEDEYSSYVESSSYL